MVRAEALTAPKRLRMLMRAYYVFDLVKLRKRYGISTEHEPPVPPPVETIDCAADIRAWRAQVEEAEEASDGGHTRDAVVR